MLVLQINEPAKSADGYELSFATNTLGCFALTLLLEPVLKRSAPARVIFVSSGGMLTGPRNAVSPPDRHFCSIILSSRCPKPPLQLGMLGGVPSARYAISPLATAWVTSHNSRCTIHKRLASHSVRIL